MMNWPMSIMLLVTLQGGDAVFYVRKISQVDPLYTTQQQSLTKLAGNMIESAAYVNGLDASAIKANRPSLFFYVESNSPCIPTETPTFDIFARDLAFTQQQTALTKTVNNVIECAAYMNGLAASAAKTQRPSMFYYIESNFTCTPARMPTFDIFAGNDVLKHGDVDVYEIVGKPVASNNLDTWFYAVFNEELSAYWGHPNFINAWPTTNVPDWTAFAYNIMSPVISYGGEYAMTFNGYVGLYYNIPPIASSLNLTMLVWYKPVGDISGKCNVAALGVTTLNNGWVSMEVTNGSIGVDMYDSIGPYPPTQRSSAVTWNGGPWTYLGFTLNGTANSITFWKDGASVGTLAVTIPDIGPRLQNLRVAANGGLFALASMEIYLQTFNQSQVQAAMVKSISGRTTTQQLPN